MSSTSMCGCWNHPTSTLGYCTKLTHGLTFTDDGGWSCETCTKKCSGSHGYLDRAAELKNDPTAKPSVRADHCPAGSNQGGRTQNSTTRSNARTGSVPYQPICRPGEPSISYNSEEDCVIYHNVNPNHFAPDNGYFARLNDPTIPPRSRSAQSFIPSAENASTFQAEPSATPTGAYYSNQSHSMDPQIAIPELQSYQQGLPPQYPSAVIPDQYYVPEGVTADMIYTADYIQYPHPANPSYLPSQSGHHPWYSQIPPNEPEFVSAAGASANVTTSSGVGLRPESLAPIEHAYEE